MKNITTIRVGKRDKVYYTRADAHFTIVKSSGNIYAIPYCERPDLMDIAIVKSGTWQDLISFNLV